MDGPPPSAPAPQAPPFRRPEAIEGVRQVKVAYRVGLLAQVLIWSSVIGLWIVGALYANIPLETQIAYGAHGFSVSAAAIFGLNAALIAGAIVALLSLALSARGFHRAAKAMPAHDVDAIVALTTVGAVGLGLFAVGWALWLGSFVAPGVAGNLDTASYVPVLAPSLATFLDLLLILGGLLAWMGFLGVAWGSGKVGSAFGEITVELGGVLSILPVLSIVGLALALVGLGRAGAKLEKGWTPPPPPPPPAYRPGFYPAGGPYAGPPPPATWDGVALALIVVLVLLWAFVLPLAVLSSTYAPTYGPSSSGSGGSVEPTSSSGAPSSAVPVALVGLLIVTAVLLPLAVVRNRRKRQRSASPPAPPPPPPPPPPIARDEDPLDHLV